MDFEAWGTSQDSLSKPLAVATPCGLAWNCTLGWEAPLCSCWPFCLLFSVAVSPLFCFFSLFPPVDSALLSERLTRLPLGKHFIGLGEMLSQVAGNPCFGGWPSPASQSQLSSCVSGHRKSVLSQGASLSPEVTGGGSAWGRMEQAGWGRPAVPGEAEAVETSPGSWDTGVPPGAQEPR